MWTLVIFATAFGHGVFGGHETLDACRAAFQAQQHEHEHRWGELREAFCVNSRGTIKIDVRTGA
jgi:hypothetical protein